MSKETKIKNIIRDEVAKHEKSLNDYHVLTITDAIYKQLNEYMSVDQMDKMVQHLRYEFIKIVDDLIPLVEEYESKIEYELDKHIGKYLNKL